MFSKPELRKRNNNIVLNQRRPRLAKLRHNDLILIGSKNFARIDEIIEMSLRKGEERRIPV